MRYIIDTEVLFVIGVPIILILMPIRLLIKRKKRERIFWLKECSIFLLSIYALLLISVTLLPIIKYTEELRLEYRTQINLVPFRDIIFKMVNLGSDEFSVAFKIRILLMNVGGNTLLLLPLGILAPILWKRFRSLKSCFLLGLMTSLSIEFLQLIEGIFKLSFRSVDIDDLILNILGAVIGYTIYKMILKIGFMKRLIINEATEVLKAM